MPETVSMPPVFFLIAGEASGDVLGVRLMQALSKLTHGEVRFMGIGGPRMRNEGIELLFPQEELAHMGFFEVVRHIPHILSRINETISTIRRVKPSAVITIDSPDFSFRVAKKLKGINGALTNSAGAIPLIHYVAPSVWAWRPDRAKKVSKFLDHLLALLPFEPPYFIREGLACTFVGHSIVESAAAQGSAPRFYAKHDVVAGSTLVTVLPGSRTSELERLMPIFAETIDNLKNAFPDLQVVIPTVSQFVERLRLETEKWPVPCIVVEGDTDKYDAFAASRAALACSGTVAVELAMAHLPSVTAYKVGRMTAFVAGRLIKTKYFNLVNIMHNRLIVPELIQDNCTPEALTKQMDMLLGSREAREAQIVGLSDVAGWLGQGEFIPSERAAQTILDTVAAAAQNKLKSVDALDQTPAAGRPVSIVPSDTAPAAPAPTTLDSVVRKTA